MDSTNNQDKAPLRIVRTPVPSKPGEPDTLTRITGLLTELLDATKKATRSRGRSGSPERKWFDTAEAAGYCGYSLDTFRDYAKQYQVPRRGPKLNRYDREELDQWMQDPSCFTSNNVKQAHRGTYKPKQIYHLAAFLAGKGDIRGKLQSLLNDNGLAEKMRQLVFSSISKKD